MNGHSPAVALRGSALHASHLRVTAIDCLLCANKIGRIAMRRQSRGTTRRSVLKGGAGLAVGAAILPTAAQAQGDTELARLEQGKRILLKGGIVLSLDPKVGDFASGDVLIEDGKIREL